MTNKELYDQVFISNLKVSADELPSLKYRVTPGWDSLTHMDMVAELEEKFHIRLETIDIMKFNTYAKGMEILSEYYGIQFT